MSKVKIRSTGEQREEHVERRDNRKTLVILVADLGMSERPHSPAWIQLWWLCSDLSLCQPCPLSYTPAASLLQFSLGWIYHPELTVPFPRTAVCPPVLPTNPALHQVHADQGTVSRTSVSRVVHTISVSQEALITHWALCLGVIHA